MSFLTIIFIIIGAFLLMAIGIVLFIWKGWPAIDRHFEEKHRPTVERCVVRFFSGCRDGAVMSNPYFGKLLFGDDVAKTYEVVVNKKAKPVEITIRNDEGNVWNGPYRMIHAYTGIAVGYSPRVVYSKDPTPYPQRQFVTRFLAEAEVQAAETINSGNGIDARLVVICVLGFIVIVAIVAGTWAFNKPQTPTVNNYYAANTTANMTYSPTTTAGGPVLVK